MKITLNAILPCDKTIPFIVEDSRNISNVISNVRLSFMLHATHMILQPALSCIKSITQGYIGILVMIAVNNNVIPRHTNMNAHIELLPLMMVLMRHFYHNMTRNKVIKKVFELFHLFTYVRFQCVRWRDIAYSDL